jgi:hypothetical protein
MIDYAKFAAVLPPADRERFEERAAIAEFDGKLPRQEAEALAWRELKKTDRGDTCEQSSPSRKT